MMSLIANGKREGEREKKKILEEKGIN